MSGQEWKIILTRPECQAISTSEVTCWSLYVKIPEAEEKKEILSRSLFLKLFSLLSHTTEDRTWLSINYCSTKKVTLC